MAASQTHRWGHIIGEVFEAAVLPVLEKFAKENGLYLDKQGVRLCRKGRKCTWVDSKGNAHDLDFVLERNGTPDKVGTPVAFIETAWRRYTKHSRNKAQEIQGALVPLSDTYNGSAPFKGAILAGVFTEGARTQLQSLGFTLLYFPYEMILQAFQAFGIDASFDEHTAESAVRAKIRKYKGLSSRCREEIEAELIGLNAPQVKLFLGALSATVSRRIDCIIVLPLYGATTKWATLDEALAFIKEQDGRSTQGPFQRYEIQIRYSNGDSIDGKFVDKLGAIEFLETYKAKPED